MTPEQHLSAALSTPTVVRPTWYRLLVAPKTFWVLRHLFAEYGDPSPTRTALAYTRLLTFRAKKSTQH